MYTLPRVEKTYLSSLDPFHYLFPFTFLLGNNSSTAGRENTYCASN